MKPVMSTVMPAEMCQFCFTNGESLEHCGSHRLKSPNGLVACPILRAFVCPQVMELITSFLMPKPSNISEL